MKTDLDTQERGAMLQEYFESWLDGLAKPACPCAYPRLRAIVAIDCRDYGGVWMCLETEILLGLLRPRFDIVPAGGVAGAGDDTWTCPVCGSSYEYGWDEFSINTSIQYLKPLHLAVTDLGAPPVVPTPLFGGIVGHTDPPFDYFEPVDFDAFRAYFEARA